MKNNCIKIYIIHIDKEINLSSYEYLFNHDVNENILSYRNYSDRLKAFTSALLKFYFLPSIIGINPNDVEIGVDLFGRPYLANYPNIDFNISHSGKHVVLGIAIGKKIGVDIEQIDKGIDLGIGREVFNPYELKQINNPTHFYTLWAKKEAYLKCIGNGFITNLYQNTRLNTEVVQFVHGCEIYSNYFNHTYILGVCVTK